MTSQIRVERCRHCGEFHCWHIRFDFVVVDKNLAIVNCRDCGKWCIHPGGSWQPGNDGGNEHGGNVGVPLSKVRG